MLNLVLEENNTKSFETALNNEMDKVVKHFQKELVGIRTGRAHTSLIEDVKVAAYEGNEVRLRDIAALSAPDARLLVIQPWDKTLLSAIEKGLTQASLGLTPVNDGDLIRITLPEMSAQRRDELVKQLHKKLEESRVAIRNIRKDFHNMVRDAQRSKKISEDFSNRLNEFILPKVTDKYTLQLEELSTKKEQEVRA